MTRSSTTPQSSEMVKISPQELQTLIVESFRYCLGRRSVAVSSCVERIIRYWDILSPAFQSLILDETEWAIERGFAGDSCDVESWKMVLELEGEK